VLSKIQDVRLSSRNDAGEKPVSGDSPEKSHSHTEAAAVRFSRKRTGKKRSAPNSKRVAV
jgi:hypothetical protein